GGTDRDEPEAGDRQQHTLQVLGQREVTLGPSPEDDRERREPAGGVRGGGARVRRPQQPPREGVGRDQGEHQAERERRPVQGHRGQRDEQPEEQRGRVPQQRHPSRPANRSVSRPCSFVGPCTPLARRKTSVPHTWLPMLFESAKNGPSTSICVACAFIARILASAKSSATTIADSSSSGTMKGGSGPSGSMPSNAFVSP